MNKIDIRIADWTLNKNILQYIRKTVFVIEQLVPEELEWDEYDTTSTHFLVSYQEEFIATGRLKPDGQLGRMAVLLPFRQLGIGSKLLDFILQQAINVGFKKVYCFSQVTAIAFYQNKGFVTQGHVFNDANIPHQKMTIQLI